MSPDPTYQDCWPSERYPSDGPERAVSTTAIGTCCTNQHDYTPESAWAYLDATVQESRTVDQCECCRAAPGTPHAIGCEVFEERLTYHPKMCEKTAQVTDSVSNAAPSHADGVRFGRETPTNLPVGAPNEHPAWVCSDCGQDRYGPPIAMSTWHNGKCGICGLTTAVTEPRDFGGHESILAAARPFLGAPYVWSCSDYGAVTDTDSIFQEQAIFPLVESSGDVKVESCPECGVVTDIDYGPGGEVNVNVVVPGGTTLIGSARQVGEIIAPHVARALDRTDDSGVFPERETPPVEETPSVPFRVQEFMFEELCEEKIAELPHLILTHSERIIEMARKRHREGFVTHGSAMYSWSPERRLDEMLQELADACVYPTSGPIE